MIVGNGWDSDIHLQALPVHSKGNPHCHVTDVAGIHLILREAFCCAHCVCLVIFRQRVMHDCATVLDSIPKGGSLVPLCIQSLYPHSFS